MGMMEAKLGVAQPGEGADNAGHHKAQRHGRTGVQGCGLAGEHKDARADDGANAKGDKVQRSQRTPERMFALFTASSRATTWV